MNGQLSLSYHIELTTQFGDEPHNRPFYSFPITHDVFFRNYRLPHEGEDGELVAPGELFGELAKAYPMEMRGMNMHRFGRMLIALGAERVHTVKGNMYRIVRAA